MNSVYPSLNFGFFSPCLAFCSLPFLPSVKKAKTAKLTQQCNWWQCLWYSNQSNHSCKGQPHPIDTLDNWVACFFLKSIMHVWDEALVKVGQENTRTSKNLSQDRARRCNILLVLPRSWIFLCFLARPWARNWPVLMHYVVLHAGSKGGVSWHFTGWCWCGLSSTLTQA